MFRKALESVIDKYLRMEVDESEGENLEFHAKNLPDHVFSLNTSNNRHRFRPHKFIIHKNAPSLDELRTLRPFVKGRRSICSSSLEDNENGGARRMQRMYDQTTANPSCVPQLSRKSSLSPKRVIPFEVFVRNYHAHIRSRSVPPLHQCSKISKSSSSTLNRQDVSSHRPSSIEKRFRKHDLLTSGLITVAPFVVLERNYRLLESRQSLPSLSESVRGTESTNMSDRTFPISSEQTPRLSRTIPHWFIPSRASTVRLSRSTLERHSLNSSGSVDVLSSERRVLSWILSQRSI